MLATYFVRALPLAAMIGKVYRHGCSEEKLSSLQPCRCLVATLWHRFFFICSRLPLIFHALIRTTYTVTVLVTCNGRVRESRFEASSRLFKAIHLENTRYRSWKMWIHMTLLHEFTLGIYNRFYRELRNIE